MMLPWLVDRLLGVVTDQHGQVHRVARWLHPKGQSMANLPLCYYVEREPTRAVPHIAFAPLAQAQLAHAHRKVVLAPLTCLACLALDGDGLRWTP